MKFRSKFIHEANYYIAFTNLRTRLLGVHTLQLAKATNDEIIDWLRTVGENYAAAWFERYWSGDRGNRTNSAACHCGNNNAQGIESCWRYMKQEVCGSANTNLRMPLRNFILLSSCWPT